MKRLLGYAVVVVMIAVTAILDLWTKRWAENNLATEDHLIVIRLDKSPDAVTVGDAIRSRFPSLDDTSLVGKVYRLPPHKPLSIETPITQAAGPDTVGFFEFDEGRIEGFARVLDFSDATAIERWLMKARSDLSFEQARRAVMEHLSQMTILAWLSEQLPHLSEEELVATVQSGLFPIARPLTPLNPGDRVEQGDIYLLSSRQIEIIPGHLDLSYAENPHGAWGLFRGVEPKLRLAIFYIFSVVAVIFIIVLLVRERDRSLLMNLALGAILGGAIGNLADRILYTYVVDFIHMYWGSFHWPRYNVADIGITCGVIAILIKSSFERKSTKSHKEGA